MSNLTVERTRLYRAMERVVPLIRRDIYGHPRWPEYREIMHRAEDERDPAILAALVEAMNALLDDMERTL